MTKRKNFVELDEAGAERLGIRLRPGYLSPFTDQQAPGAWPNGTRVAKVRSDESGDLHAPGTLGTILGSIGFPKIGLAYFVEWDASPRMPTCAVANKLVRWP